MKYKIYILTIFLIFTVILSGCNTQTNNQVTAPTILQLQKDENLHIIDMNLEKHSIYGLYNYDNRTIYFISERGPINEESLFDKSIPKFSSNACFFDENRNAFNILQGCPIPNDFVVQGIPIESEEQRALENFKISYKIADALENMNIPNEILDQTDALISIARSVNENDIVSDLPENYTFIPDK